MQGSSDNSFIPKRGAAKRKQTSGTRQIYIFTYVSYILMFATLLSSAGVFLYAQYIANQLDVAVETLNAEISDFSQADMERVLQFDQRLNQAKNRLENSVSLASVFESLEEATIDTVQINSLDMDRNTDGLLVINVAVQTDSFDSTIFQRGVYLRNDKIQDLEISQVRNTLRSEATASTDEDADPAKPTVHFQATMEIPTTAVPAEPQSYQTAEQTVGVTEILSEAPSATTTEQALNENSL